MSTDNALDALTARMLEAVKNTRESADSAAASAQQAQKMAEERCRSVADWRREKAAGADIAAGSEQEQRDAARGG